MANLEYYLHEVKPSVKYMPGCMTKISFSFAWREGVCV